MKKHRTLLLLVGLYLLVKIVVQLFGDPFVMSRSYYELYPGMIANEIIEHGARDPAYLNRGVPLYAAPIVAGFLTVPFILALGKSLATVRLVSLLISTTGFVLSFIFVRRYFGSRPAVITALLWIFPPIFFFTYDTLTFEVHEVLVVFNAAVLLLVFRIVFDQRRQWYLFVLAGFIIGFGTYYLVNMVFILPVVLALVLATDRRLFLSRGALLFVLAMIIGFTPWLMICYPELGYRHSTPFEEAMGQQIMANVSDMPLRFGRFFLFLERSLYTSDISDKVEMSRLFPWLKPPLFRLYFGVFLACYAAMLWRCRKSFTAMFKSIFGTQASPEEQKQFQIVPVLVMPILFPLIYSMTTGSGSSVISSRYLLPVHPFMFMVVALSLSGIWSERVAGVRLKVVAIAVIVGLTSIFVVSAAPSLAADNVTALASTRGYGYHLFYKLFRLKYHPENTDSFLTAVSARPAESRPEMYYGLGYYSTKRAVVPTSSLDPRYIPFYYYSLGWHTRGKSESPFFGRPLDQVREVLLGKNCIFYYLGLATGLVDESTPSEIGSGNNNPEVRANLMRAEGFRIALRGEWRADLTHHPLEDRRNIARGMGWYFGITRWMPDDPRAVRDLQPTVEWMVTSWRLRHSSSWDHVRATASTLEEPLRVAFQTGAREGRVALAKLLKAPEPQ